MLYVVKQILQRDLLLAYRQPASWLNPLFFYILITSLFPLAITPDPSKLAELGPGIIWISLIFATLLSIENIFVDDYEDGYLEQLILHPCPLMLIITAKLIAQWVITAVPLLLMSYVIGHFFYLSSHVLFILMISLLLGSPILILIGALGSALTISLRQRGILLVLMVLPLYLPIIIFGAGASYNSALGLPIVAQLSFIMAFFTLAATFLPFAIAAALKIGLE